MTGTSGTGLPGSIWARLRDAMATRAVVGDPVTVGGATILPVVRTSGAGCQCPGRDGCAAVPAGEDDGHGCGGLAVSSRPVGAFVIDKGGVSWQPAIDLNRVILGGQLIGLAAILVAGSLLRPRRPRPVPAGGDRPGPAAVVSARPRFGLLRSRRSR